MMSYIYTIIRANTQRDRERERVELLAWIRVPSLEERELDIEMEQYYVFRFALICGDRWS